MWLEPASTRFIAARLLFKYITFTHPEASSGCLSMCLATCLPGYLSDCSHPVRNHAATLHHLQATAHTATCHKSPHAHECPCPYPNQATAHLPTGAGGVDMNQMVNILLQFSGSRQYCQIRAPAPQLVGSTVPQYTVIRRLLFPGCAAVHCWLPRTQQSTRRWRESCAQAQGQSP